MKGATPIAVTEKPQSANKAKAAAKGAKDSKTAAVVPVSPSATAPDDGIPVDEESDTDADEKKSEQVELMRDRKTLELETSLLRIRQSEASAYTDRLTQLSKASQCLLQALPVQLPFHSYSSEIIEAFERNVVALPTCFVEPIQKSK